MIESTKRIKAQKSFLSKWPLQRIFQATTALVLIFFSVVLILGVRQYLLYNQCQQAVAASDQLLFQFTTVKDHLNESLVKGQEINLQNLNKELQLLNNEVTELSSNLLVPEGLKASLPSRVDLVGIEVKLRSIQEQDQGNEQETVTLIRTLGEMNLGLQQFRFGLGDHTQRILLGLHKIIAGALGLMVVLSCTLLYRLNQSLTEPLMALCDASGVENGVSCSFIALIEKIEWLQQQANQQPPPPITQEPEDPALQAQRYRSTVHGLMGTELASELTNRINGVLNYTQTLIDVEGKEEGQQLRNDILPLLLHEEKRAAEMVGIMQRVGQWQPTRPSSISLDRLFSQLLLLLDKPLRAESITLDVPLKAPIEALVPAGDLWLILVSFIDQGRRALKKATNTESSAKTILLRLESTAQAATVRLEVSNSSGNWIEGDPMLWPKREFCQQLLQSHKATLDEEVKGSKRNLLIELPCRESVV